jgi:tetratricopeptide (TPR) repeat protein
MLYETLIGILGGSLGTIIIKEVLNQINKKTDFNRDLFKVTYLRKLDKAENAIAFYYNYQNKIIEMKKSLEFVSLAIQELDDKDYDIEIIQSILDQTGKSFLELTSDKYSDINSINLYFELEDKETWNENDILNFIKSISETKSIDLDIQGWINIHNSYLEKGDEESANYYWNKALELIPPYITGLNGVVETLEKNRVATHALILKIKSQLKRY